MTQRMEIWTAAPEGVHAVLALEKYVSANVDSTLLHLVKLRASVINGCAYCVDMHSQDALDTGEESRRLFAVSTWRESPFFSAEERVALELTDSVTELGPEGVPDDLWDRAAKTWSERQLADLLLAIGTINLWNRIAVPTRKQPSAEQ